MSCDGRGDSTADEWNELVELWRGFNLHLAWVMEVAPEASRSQERLSHNLDRIGWRRVPPDRPATLDDLMEDYVDHLEHHLAQIP